MSQTILRVEGLSKTFPVEYSIVERVQGKPRRAVKALTGVSLEVQRGETLGLVGESGCGKSTLARCLVRLYDADAGRVEYDGLEVLKLRGAGLRQYNRRVQMVFQDPFSSLNPRMTVVQTLREAILVHGLRKPQEVPGRIRELLKLVGLPKDAERRLPHEFSGGQRQRIGIARALSVEPETLIADELVSALDVSVQAQVVNLLLELQERLHLTVLFVAHDLRLVRHISHRVAVMYLGRVVELADTEKLFSNPAHPYTQALLRAAPELDPSRKSVLEAVRGELPSPLNPPPGCAFHPRCPQAFDRCRQEIPALVRRGPEERLVACHLLEATEAKPQA
ncbi:MAG: ATP-binding cassette domain-containing protein [Thermaceae bacterium]|nr:ATP-binding cassette domain-containing protein [Thermaceae bacterium]